MFPCSHAASWEHALIIPPFAASLAVCMHCINFNALNYNRACRPDGSFLKAMIMEFQKEVDARGLNCPLPILKAKKALAEMASGEVLRVLATDSGSVRDFQAFARQTGNPLLEQSESNREYTFYLRRK
jgi:tRNA 2-thiouridine synthesizing protein A